MFIFAWIVLAIAGFTIIMGIVDAIKGIGSWRLFFSHLSSVLLWGFGCVWYIFDFNFLPEELAIGMGVGGAVLAFVNMFSSWIDIGFRLELEEFTTLSASAFFVMAAIQHVWPHLITF